MRRKLTSQKVKVESLLTTVGRFYQAVAREPSGSKLEVLLTYVRLKTKAWFFGHFPRFTPERERIFGSTVRFGDYAMFVYMFEEQFVEKIYWVDTPNRDPLILDCGANVGMSILFFKRYYPDCKIIAFEPDPTIFDLLRTNLETNGVTGVELHNKAVALTEGELVLSVDPGRPSGVHSTVVSVSEDRRNVTVGAVKLSEYFDRADIVKLDIEGAELQVLQELTNSGKLANVLQMILEYHHHLLDNKKSVLGEFLSILEANGWTYHVSSNRINWSPQPRSQDMLIHAYQPGAAGGWSPPDGPGD